MPESRAKSSVLDALHGLMAVIADLIDRDVFIHEEGVAYMEVRSRGWVDDCEEQCFQTPTYGPRRD